MAEVTLNTAREAWNTTCIHSSPDPSPFAEVSLACETIEQYIMAYSSTPYVGMAPKKNGGHIKSEQMTRSKCLR